MSQPVPPPAREAETPISLKDSLGALDAEFQAASLNWDDRLRKMQDTERKEREQALVRQLDTLRNERKEDMAALRERVSALECRVSGCNAASRPHGMKDEDKVACVRRDGGSDTSLEPTLDMGAEPASTTADQAREERLT